MQLSLSLRRPAMMAWKCPEEAKKMLTCKRHIISNANTEKTGVLVVALKTKISHKL